MSNNSKTQTISSLIVRVADSHIAKIRQLVLEDAGSSRSNLLAFLTFFGGYEAGRECRDLIDYVVSKIVSSPERKPKYVAFFQSRVDGFVKASLDDSGGGAMYHMTKYFSACCTTTRTDVKYSDVIDVEALTMLSQMPGMLTESGAQSLKRVKSDPNVLAHSLNPDLGLKLARALTDATIDLRQQITKFAK